MGENIPRLGVVPLKAEYEPDAKSIENLERLLADYKAGKVWDFAIAEVENGGGVASWWTMSGRKQWGLYAAIANLMRRFETEEIVARATVTTP